MELAKRQAYPTSATPIVSLPFLLHVVSFQGGRTLHVTSSHLAKNLGGRLSWLYFRDDPLRGRSWGSQATVALL